MPTLLKKTSGSWGNAVWSKVWKKLSGVWSVAYSSGLALYTEGVQNVTWSRYPPTDDSSGKLRWDPANIWMWASGYGDGNTGVIRVSYTQDVTAYTKLNVDYNVNTKVGGGTTSHRITVRAGYGAVVNQYCPVVTARQNIFVDITAVTGSVSIQVEYAATDSDVSGSILVYKIWLS